MSDLMLFASLLGFFVFGLAVGFSWGRIAQRAADAVLKKTAEEAEWEERKP